MPGSKRIRIYVGPEPGIRGYWRVRTPAAGTSESGFTRKADAVRRAREIAKAAERASVYVAGRDGRYRCEWTYPRSSDPRRTKGSTLVGMLVLLAMFLIVMLFCGGCATRNPDAQRRRDLQLAIDSRCARFGAPTPTEWRALLGVADEPGSAFYLPSIDNAAQSWCEFRAMREAKEP